MKVATWNVNSIKARGERALAWVDRHRPDILCLQEIKTVTDKFPSAAFEERGYRTAVYGQKTYNGVAILSLAELSGIETGLVGESEGAQARAVSANVGGIRVIDVYVPNGGEVGSDKWRYKLEWLERLLAHLERVTSPDEPVILCGDFNIAPDDADVAHPEKWRESVLCRPEVRELYQSLIDWGFEDTFRKHNPDGGVYSWWDYRQLAFPKGDGLRIDLLLTTAPVHETSLSAWVDREERKGKQPSDHAPVVLELDWAIE